MTHLLSRRWMIHLLLLIPALVSLACVTIVNLFDGPSADTQSQPSESEHIIAEGNVDFGPGSFNFPQPAAGLVGLSSYKATLSLSFNGTEAGQTSQWSKTFVMLTTREPAARQLTIETTGDNPEPDPVFMVEAGGASYERLGENACIGTEIEPENSLSENWEPAGFLTGVFGAEEAGSDTVNGMTTNHYTFDERALGQLDISKSTGEMWVASDGGYLVKYVLTTTGNADYFGEGIEGTLTWDYELTDINQPLTLELPADCPAGMVDAPQLPDASNVLNMPGVLSYNTSTSLTEAVAFYQEQIPSLGWITQGEPTITDTSAMLTFTQGDKTMTILISAGEANTDVSILVSKTQEGVIP